MNIIRILPHLTYKWNGSDVQVIDSSDTRSPKGLSIIHQIINKRMLSSEWSSRIWIPGAAVLSLLSPTRRLPQPKGIQVLACNNRVRRLNLFLELQGYIALRLRPMFHLLRMLTDAACVRPSEWHEPAISAESDHKHTALLALSVIFHPVGTDLFPFLVQNCTSLQLKGYAEPLSQSFFMLPKGRLRASTTPAESSRG